LKEKTQKWLRFKNIIIKKKKKKVTGEVVLNPFSYLGQTCSFRILFITVITYHNVKRMWV